MLDYDPGRDDDALFRELLPQAETLQKLVKTEETFATTGHPLVILSGKANPKRMPGKLPAPDASDPFGPEPPITEPPSIKLEHSKAFEYPTEFDPPGDGGKVRPASPTTRRAGTLFEAEVYQSDAEGSYRIVCGIDHMFAPPEFKSWPYRPPDEKDEQPDDSLAQPVFHNLQWRSAPILLPAGDIVLAGMITLRSDNQAGGDLRRLFLFLQLQL
jgi:hypothetical protein